MAVLVLCMQACKRAEPAFICALGADRATRIAERDATKAAAAETFARSRAVAAAKRHAESQSRVTGARVLATTGQQALEPLIAVRAVPSVKASGRAVGRKAHANARARVFPTAAGVATEGAAAAAPAERLPAAARDSPLPPTTAAELATAGLCWQTQVASWRMRIRRGGTIARRRLLKATAAKSSSEANGSDTKREVGCRTMLVSCQNGVS